MRVIVFKSGSERAGDQDLHDLVRAAIDALDAAVLVHAGDRILVHEAIAAEKLQALGRAHTAHESQKVTEAALRKFESVSVDLICGVPGEQLPLWEADLQEALAIRPQHISVYMLSVEPKTRFYRGVLHGEITVPDDDVQASLYEHALSEMTVQGYSHYEVSNFALPGYHSRYNLASWKREQYLGFGPSAHSFLVSDEQEIRSANVSSLTRYIATPDSAVAFREELSPDERFTEQVFLSLRINSGLDVEFLRKENKLGLRLSQTIARFEQKGWIEEHEGRLYLTPKGFLFADLIAGDFIFG